MNGLPIKELEDWFAQRAAQLGAPGAAAAFVNGDMSTALVTGKESIDTGRQVTPDTLFSLASCSKAFTATGLGLLVDEGAVDFDDHATDYLPELVLDTKEITDRVTIRDLLGMRLGLDPLGACLWGRSRHIPHNVMLQRMQYLPRTVPFREGFIYTNLAYTAVAELISRRAGIPFKKFMKERLFDRAGMPLSFIEEGSMPTKDGVAVPHVMIDGELIALSRNQCGGREGESCQYSSASDMVNWLRFNLDGGTMGGTRIIDELVLREIHSVQMPVPGPGPAGSNGYCMGWMRGEFEGEPVLVHEGGEIGASTFTILSPGNQLGVSVLLNFRSGISVRALAYELLDLLSGRAPLSRYEEFKEAEHAEHAAMKEMIERDYPPEDGKPRDLDSCEGRYVSPHSGDLVLSRDGEVLHAAFADIEIFNCTLAPLGGELFGIKQTDQLGMRDQPIAGVPIRIGGSSDGATYVESAKLGRFDRILN